MSVADATDRIHTAEQLAERFGVSVKTISRWRERGLIAHRFMRDDGRWMLGYPEHCVAWFAERNSDMVHRARRFCHLSQDERKSIIAAAREIKTAEPSIAITELTTRLAEQTGRSAETIRYTLRRHDRSQPTEAILADAAGEARRHTARLMVEALREGERLSSIAERFCLSINQTRRMIDRERVSQLQEQDLKPVPSAEFKAVGAAKRILANPLPLYRGRSASDGRRRA